MTHPARCPEEERLALDLDRALDLALDRARALVYVRARALDLDLDRAALAGGSGTPAPSPPVDLKAVAQTVYDSEVPVGDDLLAAASDVADATAHVQRSARGAEKGGALPVGNQPDGWTERTARGNCGQTSTGDSRQETPPPSAKPRADPPPAGPLCECADGGVPNADHPSIAHYDPQGRVCFRCGGLRKVPPPAPAAPAASPTTGPGWTACQFPDPGRMHGLRGRRSRDRPRGPPS